MSGTDIDPHALAANIRDLSRGIDNMRKENEEWRKQLLELLQGMASNKEKVEEQEERIIKLEEKVESLSAWRWKTIGTLSAVSSTIGALISVAFR